MPALDYSAATALRWTDWGARLGLDGRIDLASWLAFGLGGTAGFAGRDASLAGNDTCLPASCDFFAVGASSSVTTSASTTPFLANAEARVFITPMSNIALKGFVGLNYDSKVPGIQKPSLTGPASAPTSATPAGIKFERETSWYAGGGLVVRFGP